MGKHGVPRLIDPGKQAAQRWVKTLGLRRAPPQSTALSVPMRWEVLGYVVPFACTMLCNQLPQLFILLHSVEQEAQDLETMVRTSCMSVFVPDLRTNLPPPHVNPPRPTSGVQGMYVCCRSPGLLGPDVAVGPPASDPGLASATSSPA
jgi:hypothetical protein